MPVNTNKLTKNLQQNTATKAAAQTVLPNKGATLPQGAATIGKPVTEPAKLGAQVAGKSPVKDVNVAGVQAAKVAQKTQGTIDVKPRTADAQFPTAGRVTGGTQKAAGRGAIGQLDPTKIGNLGATGHSTGAYGGKAKANINVQAQTNYKGDGNSPSHKKNPYINRGGTSPQNK